MSNVKTRLTRQSAAKAIELAPLIIPVSLASFGTVAVALLILGKLHNVWVWPLGVSFTAYVIAAIWREYSGITRSGSRREQMYCDFLLLLAVFAWVGFNMFYTSQNVFVNRDPAIYTVAAEHLRQNNSLDMQVTTAFGEVEGLTASSAAFDVSRLDDDELYTQGLHLLPTLLGMIGRLFGTNVMLHTAPLFGGAALLAIYSFARLIIKPRWAVLVAGVLALSLPFIYFSRDTYTEPLAAALTFGALSLIWVAYKRKALSLWFIAGIVTGAGTLTRIDAYITLGAVAGFLTILLALSKKRERHEKFKYALAFILGTVAVALIGWLDLTLLASGYYEHLRSRFLQQLIAVAVALMAGVVFVLISWHTKALSYLDKYTKSWRGPAIFIFIMLLAIVFASRPLWLESHHAKSLPLVGGLQAAEGNEVEPTRDYAENTTVWVAWYIGPALATLGAVGIALAARRAAYDKGLELLPILFVVAGTTLVFFVRPSITPDQIWASRRLVPVILPGIAVFGVYGLSILYRKIPPRNSVVAVLWGAAALALLASPLKYSRPFLRARTYTPQLTQIYSICDKLPDNAAVIWLGRMANTAPRTSAVFCDVASVGVRPGASIEDVNLRDAAETAYKNNYIPFVAAEQTAVQTLPQKTEMTLVSRVAYLTVPPSLYEPPKSSIVTERSVYLGLVKPNGSITALTEE